MILAIPVSEFRLQKNFCARDYSIAIGGGQCLAHSLFVVMSPLVSGIDCTKTRAQREFYEVWSSFFFPGSAIKKTWDGCRLRLLHTAILTWS
jgi:hypothetical protein